MALSNLKKQKLISKQAFVIKTPIIKRKNMNKVLKGIVSGIAGAALLVSCTDCPPQNPQNYTGFIHKDTANKMIQSYLNSLDNIPPPEEGVSPQQLYSLIIDADELRTYLSDPAIKNVKVMFAHTLDYINTGNADIPAGMTSGALTIVFGGFDSSGNYVYAPGMTLPNEARGCPPYCPSTGTATNNLFE